MKDSDVVLTRKRRRAKRLEDEYDKGSEEEERLESSIIEATNDAMTVESDDSLDGDNASRQKSRPVVHDDAVSILSVVATEGPVSPQPSVASSQGFGLSSGNKNPGSDRSEIEAADSADGGGKARGDADRDEQEMDLEKRDDDDDPDVIPPSDDGAKSSFSRRRGAIPVRTSKPTMEDEDDLSQSQKELDSMEEFRRGLEARKTPGASIEVKTVVLFGTSCFALFWKAKIIYAGQQGGLPSRLWWWTVFSRKGHNDTLVSAPERSKTFRLETPMGKGQTAKGIFASVTKCSRIRIVSPPDLPPSAVLAFLCWGKSVGLSNQNRRRRGLAN